MSAAAQAQPSAAPPPPTTAAAPAPPAAAAANPPAGQTAAPAADQRPDKCQFWMERKRRHCKFDAVPKKRYCGNHLFLAEGTGPKRVPCPWDPKGGHTVLESELEKHKAKCPAYRHWLEERAQPFFAQGINSGGPDDEVAWPEGLQPLAPPPDAMAVADNGGAEAAAAAGAGRAAGSSSAQKQRRRRQPKGPAGMQAAFAAALGPQRFEELVQRVEAACDQICEEEPLRLELPPEAAPFLQPDSATCNRPFSTKHAQQQASIVGNMKQAGLLQGAAGVAYIEYGAGKGYLSHMLASCTPAVSKVVMMDVRGFKEKADRSMRHLEMQRLRCDIQDFDVAQVAGLEGGAAPWVAFGKHLCGAATDFTLRSCAREHQRQQQPGGTATAAAGEVVGSGQGRDQDAPQQAAAAAAAAVAATTAPLSRRRRGGVRGLAVATCCHHRCSWRHFVAKDVMAEMGFTPQEFEVVAWMTGWALCGHEAPAGFGGDDEEGNQQQQQPDQQQPDQQQQQQQQPGSQQATHKRSREEETPAADAGAAPPAQQQQEHKVQAKRPSAAQQAQQAAEEQEGEEEWRPQWALPRERRVAIGQRCKRLIDAARLRWLRRQGFQASLVKYVPSGVSGENRLLVATAAGEGAEGAAAGQA